MEYWALRLTLLLARLPASWIRLCAGAFGYLIGSLRLPAYAAAHRRAWGRRGFSGRPRAEARTLAAAYCINTAEFFHAALYNRSYIRRFVQFPGARDLVSIMAKGRGAIGVGIHQGNWHLAALAAGLHGVKLTFLSFLFEDRRIVNLLKKIRRRLDIETIYVGRSVAKETVSSLARGRLVIMMGDIEPSNGGRPIRFLGRKRAFARGTAILARRAGAPLFAFHIVRDGARHRLEISRRLDPRAQSEGEILDELAATLERYIRSAPDQWCWSLQNSV